IKLAPNFAWNTEDRIEEIASKYSEPGEDPNMLQNRTDLQDLLSYTIDPPTAKDFDDAVSLEEKSDRYILWVHIADVAHYVEKNSSLDVHARGRATSVYLPTKTLPMLPTHLSDNLCSLREQVPRLAMSVEIHYDKSGKKILKDCKVHNSVIIVKKNLSYDYVNEAIENGEEPFSSLNKFSKVLQGTRRGLALETDEVRLELGGQMALTTKSSSASTKMIESFMVAANETVAEILSEKKIPVIYRNHPLPDKVDVEKFNAQAKIIYFDHEIELPNISSTDKEEDTGSSLMDLLSKSGTGQGGSISFSIGSGTDFAKELKSKLDTSEPENKETPGPSVKGLAQLTDEQREQMLTPFVEAIKKVEAMSDEYHKKLGYLTVLKTLQRAIYNATNLGHFGLGSTAYLHFTSPIRRYPDVIAHRVCKAMIAGTEEVYDAEEIEEIAEHCGEQSRIAERLEKIIVGAGFSFLTRNPDYSDNRLGVVVSIFGGGIYVLLPNGIEARIPIHKMTERPTFVDDMETICFVGSKSDYNLRDEITPANWRELLSDGDEPIEVITKLGDKIAVDFIGWNHVEGKVDAAPIRIFEMVEDGYHEKEVPEIEDV
ncbi:MAG: RNB domain-containing ribonuclease, partial [Candidatus Kariarchaeaceae archaeon]